MRTVQGIGSEELKLSNTLAIYCSICGCFEGVGSAKAVLYASVLHQSVPRRSSWWARGCWRHCVSLRHTTSLDLSTSLAAAKYRLFALELAWELNRVGIVHSAADKHTQQGQVGGGDAVDAGPHDCGFALDLADTQDIPVVL